MDTIDDPHLKHQYDEILALSAVNISIGAPGPDILQHLTKITKKAIDHMLEEEEKDGNFYLFQYGINPGLWKCREELAKFLSARYGDPVMREQLILTCGSTHGIQLLLDTIVAPNGVIFVEEVTYMYVLDIFKQFPMMKIVPVPMKDDIVDVNALSNLICEEKKDKYLLNNQKIFWALFYTIPTYHNPTGTCLSAENCKRLVKLARDNSIVIICDDIYNLLVYDQQYPPHRLFFYDDPKDPDYKGGNVISNASFSKILSPAIRLGWMECSARVINIIKTSGILKSGGATNQFVSGVVTSILREKLQDKHLDMLVQIYKERMNALCDTLDRYLPSCCFYNRPKGGYFVWIHIPIDLDAENSIKWCHDKYNISAIASRTFSYTGKIKNCIRLSISFYSKDILTEAVQIFCKGLLEYIENRTVCNKEIKDDKK